MKSSATLICILSSILLAACSSGSDVQDKIAAEKGKALLKAAQKPLEQAHQIENQLQDAAGQQRQKIDELSK